MVYDGVREIGEEEAGNDSRRHPKPKPESLFLSRFLGELGA
jgi:hypothetical protein